MKIAVSLMVLSLFVNSCMFSNCIQKDLSVSNKLWFKPFKNGSEIPYESNMGNKDTLTVGKLIDTYTKCNRLEVSEYQFKIMDIQLSSKRYDQIIYAQFKATEKDNVSRSFMFVDLYAYFFGDEIRRCADRVKIESIADSIDVYTFDKSNASSEGKGLIKSLSWSKKYGIVRYITKEDEIFELVK